MAISRARRTAIAAGALVALAASLAVPEQAAALPLVGHLDLLPSLPGIPGPEQFAGTILKFFFKTFFGVDAKITRHVVEFLVAHPIFSDGARYPDLGRLRDYVAAGSWGLLTLMFTGSALRYWAAGFTSASSYDALSALGRSIMAVGALIVWPQVFGDLLVAGNMLTHAVLTAPGIQPGLTKVLEAALVLNFTPLGIGTIASVAALIGLIVLCITKIVLSTVLAVLFVSAPLAIVFFPLPETAWLTRLWAQAFFAVVLWPIVWALCFAVFAVMGNEVFNLHGSFGDQLLKPWVTVAAMFVAYKAPQLVARQAMMAGLTPQVGSWAGRALIYGSAASRMASSAGATTTAAESATAAAA